MMWKEFEKLAGYEVGYEYYKNVIEPMYMSSNLGKQEFIQSLKPHIQTDKQLAKMEKHLTGIYERANKEAGETWKAYMEESGKKLETLQKAYDDAKAKGDPKLIKSTGKSLAAKKQEITIKNAYYKDLTDQLAHELSSVNEMAVAYINDQLPKVYTLNYNAVANDINGISAGISFSVVDANTVKHLATEDKTLLPYKKINEKKDVRWNTQVINSEVLQGILQGESVQKIASRLANVTEMLEKSAMRNARTCVTSAENKGRMDMLHRAADKGIMSLKVWLAARDTRTRESHLKLDGQEQEIDDPFDSELGDIMYPGDPEADPANVYNCRCTLIYRIKSLVNQATGEVIDIANGGANQNYFHPPEDQAKKQNKKQKPEPKKQKAEKPTAGTQKQKQQKPKSVNQQAVANTNNVFGDDAYSQSRKDAAIWAKTGREAYDEYWQLSSKTWLGSSMDEKTAVFKYTAGSDDHNKPLRGYRFWGKYEGTENITISKSTADMIDATTSIISRSRLEKDIWVQRGVSYDDAVASFLGIPESALSMDADDLNKLLNGKIIKDGAFFSCGSSKGAGFDGTIFNVYCPKGTQALYCEPFSRFGAPRAGVDWDGSRWDGRIGSENETLLQRGTQFRVTKIEKNNGNMYVDIEVVAQDPEPLEKMFKEII